MNQHPQAVNVSESGKQIVRRGNVRRVLRGQTIAPRSNQLLALVPDKPAEAFGNVNVFAIKIYDRGAHGRNVRKPILSQQFHAFGNVSSDRTGLNGLAHTVFFCFMAT